MKLMQNLLHGFHNVYDANEEARMRANGWFDPAEVAATPVDEVQTQNEAPAPSADPSVALPGTEGTGASAMPVRRKRGKNKPK
jgi:hypothetical protein